MLDLIKVVQESTEVSPWQFGIARVRTILQQKWQAHLWDDSLIIFQKVVHFVPCQAILGSILCMLHGVPWVKPGLWHLSWMPSISLNFLVQWMSGLCMTLLLSVDLPQLALYVTFQGLLTRISGKGKVHLHKPSHMSASLATSNLVVWIGGLLGWISPFLFLENLSSSQSSNQRL